MNSAAPKSRWPVALAILAFFAVILVVIEWLVPRPRRPTLGAYLIAGGVVFTFLLMWAERRSWRRMRARRKSSRLPRGGREVYEEQ